MSGIENNQNGGSKDNQRDIFPIFIDEQTARVPVDGSVSYVPKKAPNRESNLPEVVEKFNDPNSSIADVIRLIKVEMALVIQDISACAGDGPAAAFKLKNYSAQFKSCREMLKSCAKEADARTKRDDLDFDGPKFKFVCEKFRDYIEEAALTVLRGDEFQVKNILNHFDMIKAKRLEELRRETKKIRYDIDATSARLPLQEASELSESPNGENLQSLESPPTVQSASKPISENRATDNAPPHQAPSAPLASQKPSEPCDSRKGENLQGSETPPTGQSESKPSTQNGVTDDESPQREETSDHDEVGNGPETLPYSGLFESEEDAKKARDIWNSISREINNLKPPLD